MSIEYKPKTSSNPNDIFNIIYLNTIHRPAQKDQNTIQTRQITCTQNNSLYHAYCEIKRTN
jgi:hypothetical protein